MTHLSFNAEDAEGGKSRGTIEIRSVATRSGEVEGHELLRIDAGACVVIPDARVCEPLRDSLTIEIDRVAAPEEDPRKTQHVRENPDERIVHMRSRYPCRSQPVRPQTFANEREIGRLNTGIGVTMSSGKPLTPLAANPNYTNGGEIPDGPRGSGILTIDGFKKRTPFEYDSKALPQTANRLRLAGRAALGGSGCRRRLLPLIA